MAMITPTILATDVSAGEIVGMIVAAVLGSSVLTAVVGGLFLLRKTRAEAHKTHADADKAEAEADATETQTDIDLGKEFRSLLIDFETAKRQAISSEERHSLERIETGQQMSLLKEQIERCTLKHQERDQKEVAMHECHNNMLVLLMNLEPELKQITSQPTLLEAVASMRAQIQAITKK